MAHSGSKQFLLHFTVHLGRQHKRNLLKVLTHSDSAYLPNYRIAQGVTSSMEKVWDISALLYLLAGGQLW